MSLSLVRNRYLGQQPPLRLIGYRKLESYHPDSPIFRLPVAGAAPRICQGLDLDKVCTYPYVSFWKTREKYRECPKYAERNYQPHINSYSPEELVTVHDYVNPWKKWTKTELIRALALRGVRWWLWGAGFVLGPLLLCGIYFIPSNRYEPIEFYMPVEEYYENYVWHDFGRYIDKKAYDQYLEARRSKKWGRNPNVDPVDYIPQKYRTDKQKIGIGEMPSPSDD